MAKHNGQGERARGSTETARHRDIIIKKREAKKKDGIK